MFLAKVTLTPRAKPSITKYHYFRANRHTTGVDFFISEEEKFTLWNYQFVVVLEGTLKLGLDAIHQGIFMKRFVLLVQQILLGT